MNSHGTLILVAGILFMLTNSVGAAFAANRSVAGRRVLDRIAVAGRNIAAAGLPRAVVTNYQFVLLVCLTVISGYLVSVVHRYNRQEARLITALAQVEAAQTATASLRAELATLTPQLAKVTEAVTAVADNVNAKLAEYNGRTSSETTDNINRIVQTAVSKAVEESRQGYFVFYQNPDKSGGGASTGHFVYYDTNTGHAQPIWSYTPESGIVTPPTTPKSGTKTPPPPPPPPPKSVPAPTKQP